MTESEFQDALADLINEAIASEIPPVFITGSLFMTCSAYTVGSMQQAMAELEGEMETRQ